TGQRGGELTVAYLEAQAKAAGLKPANGSSFRQAVKIAGVRSLPAKSDIAITAGGKALPL
ncbi:MAG TPA: aminopeptidase, partial [Massilia timonae]|nr:aminopeptidase [Massilia timonae]